MPPVEHCFRLIRKNWGGPDDNHIHKKFPYTTLCVQKSSLAKSMKRLHQKFKRMEIILDLPYHPRGNSLNAQVRKMLKKYVKFRFNDLMSFVDENELCKLLTDLYNTL